MALTLHRDEPVRGLRALHHVRVIANEMMDAEWSAQRERLTPFDPESGNGFKTAGRATSWIIRFLKKPGWPDPVRVEVWHSGALWHVYLVK